MQNRGLVPSVVENAIAIGRKSSNKIPGRIQYYDSLNKITVVTEHSGNVVTVLHGELK